MATDDERLETVSDYVLWLRERVGNALLLLPSAAVLVGDDAGRLLLVRHVFSGQWAIVGGMIEPGESPAQAAVREAREETGLTVELGGLVGAVGGPDYVLEYPNGDRVAAVSIVYSATVAGGELRPDGVETDDVRWFDEADLADADLNDFARAMLTELGILDGQLP